MWIGGKLTSSVPRYFFKLFDSQIKETAHLRNRPSNETFGKIKEYT
jgi:hypothetical protein